MLAITENIQIARTDHTMVGCPLNFYCLLFLLEDLRGYALVYVSKVDVLFSCDFFDSVSYMHRLIVSSFNPL